MYEYKNELLKNKSIFEGLEERISQFKKWRNVMARDLSFWKSKKITHLENREIYALLSSGQYVNGLELLPTN